VYACLIDWEAANGEKQKTCGNLALVSEKVDAVARPFRDPADADRFIHGLAGLTKNNGARRLKKRTIVGKRKSTVRGKARKAFVAERGKAAKNAIAA
jgi:hypothetical protein